MKPARVWLESNISPFALMLWMTVWMIALCVVVTVFALPDGVLLAITFFWTVCLFAVMALPALYSMVLFPEGVQIRFCNQVIRQIPASELKLICGVGEFRTHFLCLSPWSIEELAQRREERMKKGVFTKHDLPFVKRSPEGERRLAKEYLLKGVWRLPKFRTETAVLRMPFDPVVAIYLRRMYPQLPYVDLRSGGANPFSMYPANQIPLTNQQYRLDEAGVHILDASGKIEHKCLDFRQIKTILRVDRFVNMSNVEPGHGSYLVVSQKSIPELAEHGKKTRWHKWKKQMIEQMPEAEEMYATEFHFSSFFIWNWRTTTDCHFAHTPELEQQLRNLCPHARWVDYSQKWL
jgi:hypothetical protein